MIICSFLFVNIITLLIIGVIGVETTDGQFIEVSYPNENVTVEARADDTDNYASSVIGSSSNLASNFASSSASGSSNFNAAGGDRSQHHDGIISMSSWPSDENSSEWENRSKNLIGKRLSRNIESLSDTSNGAFLDVEYDDDDDVQWTDGYENLSTKKKRGNRTGSGSDDGDDSDGGEVTLTLILTLTLTMNLTSTSTQPLPLSLTLIPRRKFIGKLQTIVQTLILKS
jgi:hypothetical protein